MFFFFFQQDHRYHKYHSSDHVILSFVPYGSSNGFHDSEHCTDEYHGQSSIQEYDAIWWLERGRDSRYFYHPFSRYPSLKNKKKQFKVRSMGRRVRAVRQKSKQYRDSDELSDTKWFHSGYLLYISRLEEKSAAWSVIFSPNDVLYSSDWLLLSIKKLRRYYRLLSIRDSERVSESYSESEAYKKLGVCRYYYYYY